MPPPASTPELLALVRKSGLVPSAALDEVAAGPLPANPTQAAGVLVTRRLLTAFQAKLLLVGRHKGFRLGPYVLCELLGRGGMGTVYKAEHEVLRRPVAVKVLTDHRDQLTRDRFHREARAAAALDHPNIVRTHDVGRDGDAHYIVMEFVAGETLNHVVEAGGPMPVAAAADVVTQTAAGLQHAHERGFLHRDIKPANLIRTPDGAVKILDMGLARSLDKSDELTARLDKGAIVGTADYISPEQVMNDPRIDIRADIYSLGATFYALLTGRPLFGGSTVSKLAQHQLKAPNLADLGGHVPPAVKAIIARMIAKRPADRYQTPNDVIAAIQAWRTEAAQPRATAARRGRWPVWVGVGVVAVATGIALAFVFATPPEPLRTAAPPPAPSPLPPVPSAGSEPLFRLDTAAIKPFHQVKGLRDEGLPAAETGLPKGVRYLAYRAGATGQFAATVKDGELVLGIANETPQLSSQFNFQLEAELGVRLTPGRWYQLAVEYATDPGGLAQVTVQSPPDQGQPLYTNVAQRRLDDTGGEWRTVTIPFERGEKVLRATFDNMAHSPDVPPWVYLRRFELTPAE